MAGRGLAKAPLGSFSTFKMDVGLRSGGKATDECRIRTFGFELCFVGRGAECAQRPIEAAFIERIRGENTSQLVLLDPHLGHRYILK